MPQLQPLLEVGGVMVIRGREGLGAKELEDYIRDFGEELWCEVVYLVSRLVDVYELFAECMHEMWRSDYTRAYAQSENIMLAFNEMWHLCRL